MYLSENGENLFWSLLWVQVDLWHRRIFSPGMHNWSNITILYLTKMLWPILLKSSDYILPGPFFGSHHCIETVSLWIDVSVVLLVGFPRHLPCDRNDGWVTQLEGPIDLSIHDVHRPFGHQTSSFSLLSAVTKALHNKRLAVSHLYRKTNKNLRLIKKKPSMSIKKITRDKSCKCGRNATFILMLYKSNTVCIFYHADIACLLLSATCLEMQG